MLVKIAPDLTDDEARRIAELAVDSASPASSPPTRRSRARGSRPIRAVVEAAGAGGLSGPPLAARSLEVLRLIRSVVPADFCVISVGGVETARRRAERLAAGATLVQGYTAFLYRGPLWAREINRGLRCDSRRASS